MLDHHLGSDGRLAPIEHIRNPGCARSMPGKNVKQAAGFSIETSAV